MSSEVEEPRGKKVTKADRQMAKAVTFGFLYGQSAKGFVAYARTTYGLIFSLEEAERFRENFFATYPAIRAWHARCRSKARDSRNNWARTIAGRLLLAQKDDDWARFNVFTEYVVSGSCADLFKSTMVGIAAVMPEDVHIVATVHDELVLDAPFETASFCREMVEREMREAFVEMFGPEIADGVVEVKVCDNWGEK